MRPLRSSVAERPLSCRQVGRILQRYLDGDLDQSAADKVADHLEDCRRCGLEVTVYREIKASLRGRAPVAEATLRRSAAVRRRARRRGPRAPVAAEPADGGPPPQGTTVVSGWKAAQANQNVSKWLTGSSRAGARGPSTAWPSTFQRVPV